MSEGGFSGQVISKEYYPGAASDSVPRMALGLQPPVHQHSPFLVILPHLPLIICVFYLH